MSRRGILSSTAAIAVFAFPFAAMAEVAIETVTIGHPGNIGGHHDDGRVDYVYRIGKFEVTAAQYTEFLNAMATTDTYGLYHEPMLRGPRGCEIEQHGSSGDYYYTVYSGQADRPVNFVSWGDAARFANWLHNGQPMGAQGLSTTEDGSYFLDGTTTDSGLLAVTRRTDATWVIPTLDEWYKAAYHYNDGQTDNYYNYPTSSDDLPDNHLIAPDPGNNANFESDGYTIGHRYWRTVVGEFENSASPYGTFDQGGNVAEWGETALSDSYRGAYGGSFIDFYIFLHRACAWAYVPLTVECYLGFRVAEVPEVKSDMDFDGDVDLDDYQIFHADNLRDFALFQGAFTGER